MCIEVSSHKIYKDFTDHNPLGEIAERNIIVLYELPCPVNTTQAKDGDPATHVVLPVYHSGTGARLSSQDLFGIPIYLALPLEDSTSEEAIYAALVERYAPWSVEPQQLYKHTATIPESTAPSSEPPQETSDGWG
jgi:ubiquitin carboxyl-terminal hydrolase 4/11